MGDIQAGKQRERKRSAKSPLESDNTRRKIDLTLEEDAPEFGSGLNTEKPGIIKDRLRSSGRERERKTDGGKEGVHDKHGVSHARYGR